jgi:hypothetical protein
MFVAQTLQTLQWVLGGCFLLSEHPENLAVTAASWYICAIQPVLADQGDCHDPLHDSLRMCGAFCDNDRIGD